MNIKDKDFHSVIIFSLPGYLSKFTATLLTNTQLYSTNKTIDPDIFISLINEEYHHCAALHNKPAQASQSRGGWNLDEALAVSSSPPFHPNCSSQHHNGSNHGGHPQCPNSNKHVCWNCDSPNHLCSNCPEPKKTTTHLANVALDDLGAPVPYTFSTYNGTVMGCRSQYRYRYETPSSDHPGGYPQLKPYT